MGVLVVNRRLVLISVFICLSHTLACEVYDPDLIATPFLEAGDADREARWRDLDSGGLLDPDSGELPAADAGADAGARDSAMDSGTEDAGDAADADNAGRDADNAGRDANGAGRDADSAGRDAEAVDSGAQGRDAEAVDSGAQDGSIEAGDDVPVPDNCPDDPDKTEPGTCGCGIPDTDTGGTASCTGLIDALVHRYRFDGTGTTIVDSVGAANGMTNAALSGDGTLELSGGSSGEYATLPRGILSALSATTVEFWLTWQGSSQGQRALSFGTAEPPRPGSQCAGSAEYHDGSWYHFCNAETVVWPTARSVCENAGGYLVAIETAEEEQYLETHPNFTESVWTGANDLESEGEWYFATSDGLQAGAHFWSGDENGSAPAGAYENWRRDEPHPDDSAPDVDCAFIYHAPPPTWMSFGCQSLGAFVCEWQGHQGGSMSRGVWFTPSDTSDRPSLTFNAGATAVVAQGANVFPTAQQTHVALVLDPAGNDIALYIDAVLAASANSGDALANLRDADNWLGRSQVTGDPTLGGSIAELRIYDSALTSEQLATSHLAGPDPEFLEP